MLQGTLIKLDPKEHRFEYGFEYFSYHHERPLRYRHVWPLINVRRAPGSMSWFNIADAVGKEAKDDSGRVTVYMGNSCWLSADMPDRGNTKAIILETTEVPCPKVRRGIDTRWRDGHWQKYLKAQGWVNA